MMCSLQSFVETTEQDELNEQNNTTQMKAVVRERYGGPEQLMVELLPLPEISENELLIKLI